VRSATQLPQPEGAHPMRTVFVVVALLAVGATSVFAGGDLDQKLKDDRRKVEAAGFWIYNDLAKGIAEAKENGKPLVVALRCVPCVECVRLDDDMVDTDPSLEPLLEQFVRVRLITTNGLDLSTFQFDTDQSYAVFLMRADGTIYGRYGTRSAGKEWKDDVSVAGLGAALEGALALHAAWPRDQAALAKKRGPAPLFPTPEQFPALRDRYGPHLATEGNVAPSCIHCHQVGEAQQTEMLKRETYPEEALYPYPHPKSIGLVLDPSRRPFVKEVLPGSLAEKAGFRAGDEVLAMEGEPLLSIADVQWVLHGVPAAGGSVEAGVRRGADGVSLTLDLPTGWRRADDLSWRASTWHLREAVARKVMLEPGKDGGAGLEVKFVLREGPAARAGLRKGDLLLAVDGRSDFRLEGDWIRYLLEPAHRGKPVSVRLKRGEETLDLTIPGD
jgi:serine protease Do